LNFILPAYNVEVIDLSLNPSHQLVSVILEFSIVEVTQLIINFILYGVEVHILCLSL